MFISKQYAGLLIEILRMSSSGAETGDKCERSLDNEFTELRGRTDHGRVAGGQSAGIR